MRKLTDRDLSNLTGTTLSGYYVEAVRVKRGSFIDSDHYGIIIGRSDNGHYATWEFHLDDDEMVNTYWGHYFMGNRKAALLDFDNRDLGMRLFEVAIIETLKLTVKIEAKDKYEATQIVSDSWKAGEYVLDADNFVDVEFYASSVEEQEEQTEVCQNGCNQ